MTARSVHVLILAACALGLATPASAQSCGNPPDPRTNTAGYASWCSCMGGSYNYQTTECVGARGPSGGGYRRGGSGNWGCLARARNGAWGNSWEYRSESAARSRALSECRTRSKGSACSISYCRTGITASNPPRPSGRTPARSAPSRQRSAYSCAVCERKLRADLNAGWASGRTRSYVQQAIAGYQNCKRKAAPPCTAGDIDILVRTIQNGCYGFPTEAAFRQCVGRVLQ
jgi:hypothetical protein